MRGYDFRWNMQFAHFSQHFRQHPKLFWEGFKNQVNWSNAVNWKLISNELIMIWLHLHTHTNTHTPKARFRMHSNSLVVSVLVSMFEHFRYLSAGLRGTKPYSNYKMKSEILMHIKGVKVCALLPIIIRMRNVIESWWFTYISIANEFELFSVVYYFIKNNNIFIHVPRFCFLFFKP